MPRKIDPATIKVGHGLAASDSVEVNALIPGAGEPGSVGSSGSGSVAHIQDEHDAHPASAVSVDDVPKIYDASNVEGVLDELAALVPPRPPTIGHALHYFETTCIPDWGILKLDDASWFVRSVGMDPDSCWFDYEDPEDQVGDWVYPYFWGAVRPASDFSPKANDPVADPTFNVHDPSYSGGGVGVSHAGWFLREKLPVTTHRVIPSSGEVGGKEVVVSGVVFPADRGTLALIRFNTNGVFDEIGDADDFKKLRVLAALNLGQGIHDKCDGHPGGIFWMGEHGGECAPYSYDPFTFPGRATGQLDLWEIHTGTLRKKGEAPVDFDPASPFYDYDGDGTQGAPAAGQVRLGVDPNAGIPLITDGIPILGGTTAAKGGGHDCNFFRYRLPYMKDYTSPHGLRWTPPEAQHRYYDKPEIALYEAEKLDEAGDYRGFEKDYWTYQVARYRHQFSLPDDIILEHSPRDCGTYVLVHFRKEEYFEDCVRDGVMPVSEKIYSANLMRWDNAGHYTNVANAPSLSDDAAQKHSSSYHVLRSNVFEDILGDRDSEFCPGPVPPIVDGAGQHETARIDLTKVTGVMSVSGVGYLLSSTFDDSSLILWSELNVRLKEPDHANSVYGLFETSFLTHGDTSGLGVEYDGMGDADALMSQRPPAFLSMFNFTGEHTFNIGMAGGVPAPLISRGRGEYSLPKLIDPNTDPTWPVPEKNTRAALLASKLMLLGDQFPKFSREATFRAFFRRPLNHGRDFLDYTQFYNTGIRIPTYYEHKPVNVLWHGSDHREARTEPVMFSNWYPIQQLVGEDLYNERKGVQEYFLDETHRLRSDFKMVDGTMPLNLPFTETLCGPGLPHGSGLEISIPPTCFEAFGTAWEDLHWLSSESNIKSLVDDKKELQVAGWPDRNPPIEDGVKDPTMPNGVLIYPQHNYSLSVPPGPDYSGISEDSRSWVRYFNVGQEGDSQVDIKIEGIKLEDFEWSPPEAGSKYMAILIKVPGRTTWMDIGRRDGDGPSKQDPFADGAGCMVVGPETKDLDPVPGYGVQQCKVRCNLGPAASLYKNSDGHTQLLMKVVIYSGGATLNLEQGGPDGSVRNIRGLVSLHVAGVR